MCGINGFRRIILTIAATWVSSSLSYAAPESFSFSNFRWVVTPGMGVAGSDQIPHSIPVMKSNNNVAVTLFEGRIFMAWRSAPTHFAGNKVVINVVSSGDQGLTWDHESVLKVGADLREPHLVGFGGKLYLYCFQGGTKITQFSPVHMLRSERLGEGQWTDAIALGRPGEVPWEMKVYGNEILMSSYAGAHYSAGPGSIDVFFSRSRDGLTWSPVGKPVVYRGGVSEVSFEFDLRHKLWGVTRNEDGDQSGWGSHLISAEAETPGQWDFPAESRRDRFDSPRMFRHGAELYLVARRDVGGPFDLGMRWLPFNLQRWLYLGNYSLRPKRTSLYYINRETRTVEWMQDLPSAGDNAFPSIIQIDTDRYLIANYSSPLKYENWDWLHGQLSKKGTGIYFVELNFAPGSR